MFLLGLCGFFPAVPVSSYSPDMHVRVIGDQKLPLGVTEWCVSGDEVAIPPGCHPASQWDRIQHLWRWKDRPYIFQNSQPLASGISSSNHARHGCSSASPAQFYICL